MTLSLLKSGAWPLVDHGSVRANEALAPRALDSDRAASDAVLVNGNLQAVCLIVKWCMNVVK